MAGLEVLDPRYAALLERARAVLEADPRVANVELSGSLATGTADRWSDLDLAVVAHPEHHASLLADWPKWLAEITPTVFARTPIAPMIINTITDEGLTFDLSVWSGSVPDFGPPSQHYSVGSLSSARFDDVGAAMEYAVAEQLRGLAGPFISLLQSEEHLRHLTGVPHLTGLLTTVFLAETGAKPPGKHWNTTYTEEQRNVVAQLPAVCASREDLIAFGLGLAELLVTRARPLYPRYGLEWPAALAKVAADRMRTELAIDTSRWLH